MADDFEQLVLPPEAQADIAIAHVRGRMVFYGLTHEPSTGLLSACPNCGGSGIIPVQFAEGGPFRDPVQGVPLHVHDDKWYAVTLRVYQCSLCSDSGARIMLQWKRSGLEENERDWSLDYLQGMAGKEIAVQSGRDLLAGLPRPAGWIVYYGGYGVGKSGILKSLVAAAIRSGVNAHYTRAETILQKVRATFGERSGSELAVLKHYQCFQLLAIDEFDRTSTTDWARATLLSLLDARYNQRAWLATLLASNQAPEALPTELDYLASRLKDGLRIRVGGAGTARCPQTGNNQRGSPATPPLIPDRLITRRL